MTVSELWKKWRSRQISVREFNALDPAQRDELARDTGVDRATLEILSAQGNYREDELEQLMDTLALDIGRVKRTYPAVFRDMSVVCSECIARSVCRHHLDEGTARQAYEDYCPNTLTLNALRREQPIARLVG